MKGDNGGGEENKGVVEEGIEGGEVDIGGGKGNKGGGNGNKGGKEDKGGGNGNGNKGGGNGKGKVKNFLIEKTCNSISKHTVSPRALGSPKGACKIEISLYYQNKPIFLLKLNLAEKID